MANYFEGGWYPKGGGAALPRALIRALRKAGGEIHVLHENKANPLGAIGSVAAMLSYSFGLKKEAEAVENAIEAVLASGKVTADLRPKGTPATTEQVGAAVCELL